MTPEAVEALFYKTYSEDQPQKPLVQKDLRMKCWQAVIDHIEKPWKDAMLQTIEKDAQGLDPLCPDCKQRHLISSLPCEGKLSWQTSAYYHAKTHQEAP